MSESLHSQNTQDTDPNKTFIIKMPVFITSVMNRELELFGMVSYPEMIEYLYRKLSSFEAPISSDNRYKTKKTVISKITPKKVSIGDIPSLLLKINAYNTNFYEGYFEGTKKINITRDNKIGSDSYYVLFYPRISGLTDDNYSCFFLMLVYEDPTKDSGEVSRIAKIIANKVLNIPVENIKLPMILNELENIGLIPELQVKYYSVSESENNVDVKYATYLQSTKIRKEEVRDFKNVPFEVMKDLLSDTSCDGNYQKKVTSIISGKKEYKISKKIIADGEIELKETAEKIFNATTVITQTELEEKVHNIDFMIEKMSAVITNYISYNG